MKTAFALYDGFSVLDFAALFDPLAQTGAEWQVCAQVTEIYDARGLHFYSTSVTSSLEGYDLVIVPGGKQKNNPALVRWLASASGAKIVAAVNEGVLLAAAAGLGRGMRAAAKADIQSQVAALGLQPVREQVIIDQPLVSAAGPEGIRALARWLVQLVSGANEWSSASLLEESPIPVTGQADESSARRAVIKRETGETRVEVRLDVDGTGLHEISTGLPFLDHMLAQIAVHGLFDLYVKAEGDLQIDPHHTTEDTALTLGAAFLEALGSRKGITRMASADCPMDESLARAAVDFSGRPYCVVQAEWHGPAVGTLPVSLIAHFFESFAINARCNLHAEVRYGRDDHHQVEALFKAFARALCAATRIDPRRAGQVPSSKGILF